MVSWGGLASASSSDAVGPIQSNSPITCGANQAYLHAWLCLHSLVCWMSREIFCPYHQPAAQAIHLHAGPTYVSGSHSGFPAGNADYAAATPIAAHWQPTLCSAMSHMQRYSRVEARLHQCRGGTGADRSVLLSSSSTLKAARAYLSWRAST